MNACDGMGSEKSDRLLANYACGLLPVVVSGNGAPVKPTMTPHPTSLGRGETLTRRAGKQQRLHGHGHGGRDK